MRFPVQLPCRAKLRNSAPPRATKAEMYLPRGWRVSWVARLQGGGSPSLRGEQAETRALSGPEPREVPLQELRGDG